METSQLIETLAQRLEPVRLFRPWRRAASWVAVAMSLIGLLALARGMRSDLSSQLASPTYLVTLGATVITGVLAALSTFLLSVPDRSRWWGALPVPPLLVWGATLGYQCLTAWIAFDPAGMTAGETARCFATVVLVSAPMALVLWAALRRTAVLRPTPVALTGGLAVAGFTGAALALLHDIDASVLVLGWNGGLVATMLLVAYLSSRRLTAGSGGVTAGASETN